MPRTPAQGLGQEGFMLVASLGYKTLSQKKVMVKQTSHLSSSTVVWRQGSRNVAQAGLKLECVHLGSISTHVQLLHLARLTLWAEYK